jgi:hypothetical protein
VGLFPIVASRAIIPFRVIALVLLATGLINLYNSLSNTFKWDDHAFALEGSRYITDDEQKSRMMQIVGQTKQAIYLSGKCAFCYNEAPALAVFTGNKSYIAWSWFESHANFIKEAESREKQDNDFYSGAMTDRLRFLQDNHVTGVLIWPDDDISDDFLGALRKELDSDYSYIDCKGTGAKNAGVFVLRSSPSANSAVASGP